MLNELHNHIVNELGQSSRTDTIFVVTAVVFNLIVLGVNSGVATGATETDAPAAADLVLAAFMVMTILLNVIAVSALFLGRRTRSLLLNGLVGMYHDNDVEKYYDPLLVSNYGTRYVLFAGVILTLAVTAVIVPLIIRFTF